MPRLLSTVLAAVLLAAGCQMPPQEPSLAEVSRDYQQRSKREVWDSLMAALQSHDLPVVQADFEQGRIQARQSRYLNPAWARCSYGRIFDPTHPTNTFARAWPLYQGVDLRMAIIETDDNLVRLTIRPAFYDRQIDTQVRNFPYQVPCLSTGLLENDLLDAPGP